MVFGGLFKAKVEALPNEALLRAASNGDLKTIESAVRHCPPTRGPDHLGLRALRGSKWP